MEVIDENPCRYSTKATAIVYKSERLLLKLGHGYKRAKAQQIFRLLKDQEALNKRFKDCALDESDEAEKDEEGKKTGQVENDIEAGNADIDTIEQQLNKKRTVGVKKVSSNVDPGRCRTSMGFYNEAECSNFVDGDIDIEAAANADLELDMGAEADMPMDDHEVMMSRLALAQRCGNQRRRLFRPQMNEETEPIPEESVAQSARSSRPKTGIASSSARGKQYRRQSQTDSQGRSLDNSTISTTVSKLDAPFTARGGLKGFCDGHATPREDKVPCLTPRQADLKLCLTPRHEKGFPTRYADFNTIFMPRQTEPNMCYTPRHNDFSMAAHTPRPLNDHGHVFTPRPVEVNGGYTPRPADTHANLTARHNDLCFSPRRDDHGRQNELCFSPRREEHHFSPRQNELCFSPRREDHHFSPRQNELCFSPRREDMPRANELRFSPRRDDHIHVTNSRPAHPPQRGMRNYQEDTATLCITPRQDETMGGITPRSYNKLPRPLSSINGPMASNGMKNGRLVEKSLFEMSPAFSNEPARSKTQSGTVTSIGDHNLSPGRRAPQHVSRAVLTVEKSPVHVIPTAPQDGEVTPRRPKPEVKSKKRGRGDMQRVGVHQNLSKIPAERVHPIAVMKLPPLDTGINKQVVS